MIKCVVIDDEPLARENIANYVENVDYLQLIGQGSNPLELNEIMAEHEVDLIFLDIQMPVINGIDFLKITPNLPMVILTTAYPSYALEGFELDVLDYLLKPITFNRFLKAVNKAHEFFGLQRKSLPKDLQAESTDDYFFIKCDNKFEKIIYSKILFVQALQNYVTIHTEDKKYVSLLSLKVVEQKLVDKGFIRVHKSYIVAKSKIDNMESHEISIKSHRIPISRNHRKTVKEEVLSNHLWKNDNSSSPSDKS